MLGPRVYPAAPFRVEAIGYVAEISAVLDI